MLWSESKFSRPDPCYAGFGVDGIRLRCYTGVPQDDSGGRNAHARKAGPAGKSRSGMPQDMTN
jgi:hypothetical protein